MEGGCVLDIGHIAELFSLEARRLPFDYSFSQSLVAPGLMVVIRLGNNMYPR